MSKWSEADTIKFVQMYAEKECLWNKNSKHYKNKKMRAAAEEDLCKRMHKEGFGSVECKQKIKNIRSTYNQQVIKIRNSKMSGDKPENLFVPTLKWFHIMDGIIKKSSTDIKEECMVSRRIKIVDKWYFEINKKIFNVRMVLDFKLLMNIVLPRYGPLLRYVFVCNVFSCLAFLLPPSMYFFDNRFLNFSVLKSAVSINLTLFSQNVDFKNYPTMVYYNELMMFYAMAFYLFQEITASTLSKAILGEGEIEEVIDPSLKAKQKTTKHLSEAAQPRKKPRTHTLTEAIEDVQQVTNTDCLEENEAFGRYVVASLNKLPAAAALTAQGDIQKILQQYRLFSLARTDSTTRSSYSSPTDGLSESGDIQYNM